MDIVLRVITIYFVLLIGLRVLGKREFGELSPLELVTLLLIPEIVSQALVRETSLITTLIGVGTLLSVVFVHSQFMHMIPRFETVMDGTPTVLVEHGRFLEDNLNRERVSPDEIYSELHKSGLEELKEVRWAVLETDGTIAIVREDKT